MKSLTSLLRKGAESMLRSLAAPSSKYFGRRVVEESLTANDVMEGYGFPYLNFGFPAPKTNTQAESIDLRNELQQGGKKVLVYVHDGPEDQKKEELEGAFDLSYALGDASPQMVRIPEILPAGDQVTYTEVTDLINGVKKVGDYDAVLIVQGVSADRQKLTQAAIDQSTRRNGKTPVALYLLGHQQPENYLVHDAKKRMFLPLAHLTSISGMPDFLGKFFDSKIGQKLRDVSYQNFSVESGDTTVAVTDASILKNVSSYHSHASKFYEKFSRNNKVTIGTNF